MARPIKYVQMPQNDVAQIDQIVKEYGSLPAKGLAHGVQKDAIQNGVGARLPGKEKEAFKSWKFSFELAEINGSNALVFWDEGTCGLTGDIIDDEEIRRRMARQALRDPEQRLARFLARFESGGNQGPGSFGRGKLIFHGASKDHKLLIDSKRLDGKYVALDRYIRDQTMVQPEVPYEGRAAENFIVNQTGGVLHPLKNPGTRIAILNIKPEIEDAINYSFLPTADPRFFESLNFMIGETWWEILHKFGAQILIKRSKEIITVSMPELIARLAVAKDGNGEPSVYRRENITLRQNGSTHRIKELKLAVFRDKLPDDIRKEVWIQRKRMKVGNIFDKIDVDARIADRICGYLVLEPDLEDEVEQAEGTTHYGYDHRGKALKAIREQLRTEVKAFEKILGLQSAAPAEIFSGRCPGLS